MDTFKVTDEGGGIIRVDAETRLMRKPMAEAICHEVTEVAGQYDQFKILMNMGAMSKGTPGAGLYTLREMKKYDLSALALYRANGFMRKMASVVLGAARFSNFALFTDEDEAMEWLKNSPESAPIPATAAGRSPLLPAAVLGGGAALWLRRRRKNRRKNRRAGDEA